MMGWDMADNNPNSSLYAQRRFRFIQVGSEIEDNAELAIWVGPNLHRSRMPYEGMHCCQHRVSALRHIFA